MYVVVVVVVLGTVAAKGVAHRVVGGRNGVHNAFIHKSLQGAVNSYAVKFFACLFFNIAMCQRIVAGHKKRQDFFAAIGNTQVLAAQKVRNSLFRCFYCCSVHDRQW